MSKSLNIFFLCMVFHTSTNAQTWVQKDDFPGTARDDGVSVTVGNKSYFGTGRSNNFSFLNDWWEYDHRNDTLKALSDFPGSERQYASVTSVNQEIFLMGGIGDQDTVFNDVWKYDAIVDSWTFYDT